MPRRRRAQKEENLWSPVTKWLLLFVKSELGTALNSTAYGQGAIFPDIQFDRTTSELRIGVKRSIRDECAVQVIQVAAGSQEDSGFPILKTVIADTYNSLHAVFAPQSLNGLHHLGTISTLPLKLKNANVSIRSFDIIVSAQKPKDQWITLEIDSVDFLGHANADSGLVREHRPVNKYSFVADAIQQLPGLGLGAPDGALEITLSQLAYEGSSDEEIAAEMVEIDSEPSTQDNSTPLMSQAPMATPSIYTNLRSPNKKATEKTLSIEPEERARSTNQISNQSHDSDESEEFGSQPGSPTILNPQLSDEAGLLALWNKKAVNPQRKDQSTGTVLLNKLKGVKSKVEDTQQNVGVTVYSEPNSPKPNGKRNANGTETPRNEGPEDIIAQQSDQEEPSPPALPDLEQNPSPTSPNIDEGDLQFQPYDVDEPPSEAAHRSPATVHSSRNIPQSLTISSNLTKNRKTTIPAWLGVTHVTRGLFCVPSSQRHLLDRQQSWIPPEKGSRFPEANIPEQVLKDIIRNLQQRRNPTLSDPRQKSPAGDPLSDGQESSTTDNDSSDSDSVMPRPTGDSARPSSPYEWESSPPRGILHGIDAEMPPDSSLTKTHAKPHFNTQPLDPNTSHNSAEPMNDNSPQKMTAGGAAEVDPMDVDDAPTANKMPKNIPSSPPMVNCEMEDILQSQQLSIQPKRSDVQVHETPYAKTRVSDHVPATSQSKVSSQKQHSSGKTTSTTTIPCTYQDKEETEQTPAKPIPQDPEQPRSSLPQELSRDSASGVSVPAKRPPKSPHASEKRPKKHRKIKSNFGFDGEDPVPRNPSLGALDQRQAFIEGLKKRKGAKDTTAQTEHSNSQSPTEDHQVAQVSAVPERSIQISPKQHHQPSISPVQHIISPPRKEHSASHVSSHRIEVSPQKEPEQTRPRHELLPQATTKVEEALAGPVHLVHPQPVENGHNQTGSSIPAVKPQPQLTKVSMPRPDIPNAVQPTADTMQAPIRPMKTQSEKKEKTRQPNRPAQRSWHEDSNTPFKEFAGRYVRLKSFEGRMGQSARDGDPIERAKTRLDVLAWPLGPPGGSK